MINWLTRDKKARVNPRRDAAITMLADGSLEEPIGGVAEAVGVRPETVRKWLGEQDFRRAMINHIRDEIRTVLPRAKAVLLQKALEDGDKECLKMVIGICGLLEKEPEAPDERDTNPLRLLSDEELERQLARLRRIAP